MVQDHWPVGSERIIISGDWETLDRETIKNRVTSGRLRDGLAFIAWVNSFHDYKSEDGQIALNAEFKRIMVVKPDGAGGNLASMRKRWLDGFSVQDSSRPVGRGGARPPTIGVDMEAQKCLRNSGFLPPLAGVIAADGN